MFAYDLEPLRHLQAQWSPSSVLSTRRRVTHMCVSKLGHHCFSSRLVAQSGPIICLNKCWLIVNWTIRNKFQWYLSRNKSFPNTKMYLGTSSAKRRPSCFGLNMLIYRIMYGLPWITIFLSRVRRCGNDFHECRSDPYIISFITRYLIPLNT